MGIKATVLPYLASTESTEVCGGLEQSEGERGTNGGTEMRSTLGVLSS